MARLKPSVPSSFELFGNGVFTPEQEKQRSYGEAAHRKYPWGESRRFRVVWNFLGNVDL